jgi:inner membrane protease subunit 1
MERIFRSALRSATPGAVFRLTLDGLGLFCACTLVWEHLVTVQLSEGPSMYPTFNPRGDYLMISRVHKYGRGIEVGDVVLPSDLLGCQWCEEGAWDAGGFCLQGLAV